MVGSTSVGKVQLVALPDGERTWTVLGADYLPVAPVEEFLEPASSLAGYGAIKPHGRG